MHVIDCEFYVRLTDRTNDRIRLIAIMCWSLHVYWTVFYNLFARFITNVANLFYNKNNDKCCSCCCCCCCGSQKHKHVPKRASADSTLIIALPHNGAEDIGERSSPNFHDYVIVDDIDADYLEIQRHKIETEPYYRTVDRATAEEILTCRDDGSCLVRPYKESDMTIKYIVSIYAKEQYFHLFIRQIYNRELYAIGQEKSHEKVFTTPSDIIEFYTYNPLFCTNKVISISLLLRPIMT